jgi:PHD/YefM family antitoxin component YafN of YafNO toxin-antitoxin module
LGKSNAIRVRRLSIAEARANLSKIAKHAHDSGEYFFVGGNGAPVIGIMDAEELEDYLELRDPKVQHEIQKSNEEYLAGKNRPFEEFLADLDGGKGKRAKSRRRQRA